jgi:hypothetical protein
MGIVRPCECSYSSLRGTKQSRNRHTDDTDLKGFSQIRKKSAIICINLRYLRAYCYHNNHSNHINHSSDIRKKSVKICINLCHLCAFFWIASFLAMTNNCVRKDGLIYKHADDADSNGFSQIRKKSAVICINLRHLRAFCYHNNHSNHINHSSDKKKGLPLFFEQPKLKMFISINNKQQ